MNKHSKFHCKYALGLLIGLAIVLLAGTASWAGPNSWAGTTSDQPLPSATHKQLNLTAEEKAFIAAHPTIRLGIDPEFMPYEFIDKDQQYKGIAADYLDLIAKMTGLQMIVNPDLTWDRAYEMAVERDLDILPCVAKTASREQYFIFSDSYVAFERVIFVNAGNNEIKSFDDLAGQTVAVQNNSSHQGFLAQHPEIKASLYPTIESAVRAVADGREAAFIGNLASTNYTIKSLAISNLKYIPIENEKPQTLHIAVRSDWPLLLSILNKSLANISVEEKIAISNRWIGVEKSYDFTLLIQIAVILGSVITLVMIVSFFWIIRLRKEILVRKKTQEDLKIAKDEAERANEVKSLFLARMSHEIRTPLNAIQGMSYLLGKTDMTNAQRIYLEKLSQASRNMLGIINDILDFSKIEAGKIEIEHISYDLDKILQRVINIVYIKVEEKELEFILDKDPEMPIFLYMDPVRIEQILLNIVNNAVKFTEKGSVSLSVRQLEGNIEAQESFANHDLHRPESKSCRVEFCIRDTGVGMNAEQQRRLFTPFDQGDVSISRRFGGTGLGLSIVKSLVDLMGGKILVQSEVGKGTEFRVQIDLEVDTSRESLEQRKMNAEIFADIRALVVDKNEMNRARLASYLVAFGMVAETAKDEQEAMALMQSAIPEQDKLFNLIIVDFATPVDDGINWIHALQQTLPAEKRPKTILLTPPSREDLFDTLDGSEIDFALAKPVVPSVLYNGVAGIFKIVQPEISNNPEPQENLVSTYPYHLLVVEDNKVNQFIAQSILEQAGFRISLANNGDEGYQFFLKNKEDLDLILMDIHMEVMDGLTATRLIRDTGTEIPIIAMTADVLEGFAGQCRLNGFDDYVSKPFEPAQLFKTILRLIRTSPHDIRLGLPDKEQASAATRQAESNDATIPEPELNTEDGLKRIGGNVELYQMVLREFHHENQTTVSTLELEIANHNLAEAIQIVHKVKSSLGNIGAANLHRLAADLQKALKEQSEAEIRELASAFHIRLNNLLIEIERLIKLNRT